MPKWGSTELNIIQDSYRPPYMDAGIREIQILPDLSASTDPASVLQQSGRGRKRVLWDGWVATQAEYEAFQNDFIAATERTFEGYDSVEIDCLIASLSPPQRIMSNYIRFSVELVEA